jgi:hypothetical protein
MGLVQLLHAAAYRPPGVEIDKTDPILERST